MSIPDSKESALTEECRAVAQVVTITMPDGKRARVIRALSEPWILAVKDGTKLVEAASASAINAELLRELERCAVHIAAINGDSDECAQAAFAAIKKATA